MFGAIAGFRVLALPLNVPDSSNSDSSADKTTSSCRYLYAKRHRPSAGQVLADGHENSTLFVANIPPPPFFNATLSGVTSPTAQDEATTPVASLLQNAFETSVGAVENVTLKRLKGERQHEGCSCWTAHIKFVDPASLEKLFHVNVTKKKKRKKGKSTEDEQAAPFRLSYGQLNDLGTAAEGPRRAGAEEITALSSKTIAAACGELLEAHLALYPDIATLRQETNEFIAAFETREEQTRLAIERKRAQMDDDGFTLVTRKHQVRHATIEAKSKKRKKKGGGAAELKNFYRFQMREAKRDQLARLRAKFEADKKRVARLKASRKFKAY